MSKKKVIHLKPGFIKTLKVLGVIAVILLGVFIFYNNQIGQLTSKGYSREASKKILFAFKKDYALSVGEIKTLNAAFESSYYNEKNLDHYSKIKYQEQEHIIKNINKLLSKGYTNSDISIILAHGTDEDVTEFSKKEKVKYLEEFFEFDFAKIKNYDRYLTYSDETGEDEETTVLHINLDMDKEDYTDAIDVKKFSTDMLVNKHFKLDDKYIPDNLATIDSKYTGDDKIKGSRIAVNAFYQMAKAAEKENLSLVVNSGYRSFEDQTEICDTYRNLYGDDYVKKYVAQPGFSEHQTGLAFDIGSATTNVFVNSNEFNWIVNHCFEYGFILRFPKRFESITGFRSEAWHYRYVGKEIATYIEENNISYEEYYATFIDK